jgi:hypothetical protein
MSESGAVAIWRKSIKNPCITPVISFGDLLWQAVCYTAPKIGKMKAGFNLGQVCPIQA